MSEYKMKSWSGCLAFAGGLSLLVLLTSCAKEIRGAGSASLSPGAYEISAPTAAEDLQRSGFKIGFGTSNLRPFLAFGYSAESFGIGMGIGGLIYEGIRSSYNVGVGDGSFIYKAITGKRSFLGIGGGLGGAIASDRNFSEESEKHHLTEAHIYSFLHLAHSPKRSDVTFFFNFKVGAYILRSSFLKSIAEELQSEDPSVAVKENFIGLLYGPALGMQINAVDNRVLLLLSLNFPLTSALLIEPDLHPYVPSFNLIMIYQ